MRIDNLESKYFYCLLCLLQQNKFTSHINNSIPQRARRMNQRGELKTVAHYQWHSIKSITTFSLTTFQLGELQYWNYFKICWKKYVVLVNTYSLCTKWLRRSWVTCSCHAFLTPVLEGGAAVGIELRFPTLPEFVPSFIRGLKQRKGCAVRVQECKSL